MLRAYFNRSTYLFPEFKFNKPSRYLSLKVFILFATLAYPIFYSSYKFGSPDVSGQRDFYDYYPMYSNMDIEQTDAPFNMRILSTGFVYLLGKTNFYYPVEACYHKEGISQKVYFQSIFIQFLSAVLSAFLIWLIIVRVNGDSVAGLISGGLYLLQYGTLFWGIVGMTDAFSGALFCGLLYFFFNRSYLIIPLLIATIFQRELIILGFGVTAGIVLAVNWIQFKKIDRYFLIALGFSILAFVGFMMLRATFFNTAANAHQLAVSGYFSNLQTYDYSISAYLRGTIISQNIIFVYLTLLVLKSRKGLSFNIIGLLLLVGIFVFFHLTRAAIRPDFAQVGRHIYMLSGVFMVFLGLEIHPLLKAMYQRIIGNDEKLSNHSSQNLGG